MKVLPRLFANNRAWAAEILAEDPGFFQKLTHQQAPEYLWIGCSDSRVPANQIVGLLPGEMFVHRNVANVVPAGDLNCHAALQYAVDCLRVRHVIVCGHYGCGGVRAVLDARPLGLVDEWLAHVEQVRLRHARALGTLAEDSRRHDRLCELNVLAQAAHVCQAPCVRGAWERGQPLTVHGWIYAVSDGLLRDLGFCVSAVGELETSLREAESALDGAASTSPSGPVTPPLGSP